MIPLRIHRLLLLLLGVGGTLVMADGLLHRAGVGPQWQSLLSGGMAGSLVFLLAFEAGRLFQFCGKGLVEDPGRRARIRAALFDIGLVEERRRGGDRRRASPAFHPLRTQGEQDKRRGSDRRSSGLLPPGKTLIYVSIVDSRHFIAITVNFGKYHRIFVSSRVADALSESALRGVLAHEYGHIENRHPIKRACILGIVAAVKFAVGIPLGAAVTLLMVYLFMVREWEYVADATALRFTCPEDVLAAFSEYRLIEGNKQEMGPVLELFSGYPGFSRRIAALRSNPALSAELSPGGQKEGGG